MHILRSRSVVRAALLAALAGASAAAAAPAPQDPAPKRRGLSSEDRKAFDGFRLTVALLEKAALVHEKLLTRAPADPRLAGALSQAAGGGSTVAEAAQRIEANPAVAAALREAGLSARDYLLTVFASTYAGMVAQLEEKGTRLTRLPPGVSAANVALLQREGAAAFKRLQESSRKLQAATRRKDEEGPAGEEEEE